MNERRTRVAQPPKDYVVAESSPVDVLLRTAFGPVDEIDRTEEQTLNKELTGIDRQKGLLNQIRRRKSLPFEKHSIELSIKTQRLELQDRVKSINARLSDLSREQELQRMHIYMAENGYREQLDLKPLEMRHDRHLKDRVWLPAFMVSPIDNRSGKCQIIGDGEYRFAPKIPEGMAKHLRKAVSFSGVATAYFSGHAPDRVLEEVTKARRSRLFDQILVIGEVEEWGGTIKPVDPIIAGWKEETQQLYFINAYDMTPLEQYFRDQFGYEVTVKK